MFRFFIGFLNIVVTLLSKLFFTERNIVYVGRLESTTRKEDLQQKFQPYGKIVKITLHMKANG